METGYKPVVETYVRKTKELIHFIIGGKEVVTTPEHPFYVVGAGFVAAALLCIGTPLVDVEGKELQVEQIYREDLGQEEVPVYNFQVEDWHTYHVSDAGVLVHNAGAGYNDGDSGSSKGVSEAKYQVGAYKDIKGVEGLDAHHAGQKAAMKKLVDGYDELTAPAINVPRIGHTKRHPVRGIVSRSTKGITNARQLLARDIMELRRVYPDIPNSKLQELIEMNKKLYPEMRK